MFVCLCRAVSSVTVAAAIERGARTADAIGEACGAGTVCGKCRATIERMIAGPVPSSRVVRGRDPRNLSGGR